MKTSEKITAGIRQFLTGLIIFKVYRETGFWTALFAVLVTVALEVNVLSWKVLMKALKDRTGRIL